MSNKFILLILLLFGQAKIHPGKLALHLSPKSNECRRKTMLYYKPQNESGNPLPYTRFTEKPLSPNEMSECIILKLDTLKKVIEELVEKRNDENLSPDEYMYLSRKLDRLMNEFDSFVVVFKASLRDKHEK